MNIALLTPPYDLMKEGYGSKRKLRGGLFTPLGLAYLASPLIKDGHNVKIIDASSYQQTNEEIEKILLEFKPDIVGISSVTGTAPASYSLANYLKSKFKNLPIIYGGPHASCFAEAVFENIPELDLLVYGEGEIIFKNIIDKYSDTGKIPKDLHGTCAKVEGKFVKNEPAKPVLNLDDLMPPAYHLFDYHGVYRPLPLQYKKLPAANMVMSRGCPYGKCTFCFSAGRASQIYRRHSPKRVVGEIKYLIKNHGVKEIAFWDDNFLISEKWVFEFCDLLDKGGIKIPWSACGRVNTATRPMLERAAKSGLWNVFYGLESGNQDILDRIKKGITLEEVRQAMKWCNELGIDTRGSFMLFLPGETPEKAMNTIKFACDIGVTYAQFQPTHPEWGTELYDDAVKSGQIFTLYKGRTAVSYLPEAYKDSKQAREMQKRAYRMFYFRPSYIWKHIKRLRHISKIKQYFNAAKYIIGIST
ncbi:B12-binding domain-containing radical SAM protein [Patescibacteria group bacterium]|nr:B12-binding domain-containing radical SAM protein [Patescibacteria group bacterium]